MNCNQARSAFFDSLVHSISEEQRLALEAHLASCEDCRAVADEQRNIDELLTVAVPPIHLSAQFRTRLRTQIRRPNEWPDYWPDLAHVAGCVFAIVLLAVFLPDYRDRIAMMGTGFTIVTYFAQAVMRGADA